MKIRMYFPDFKTALVLIGLFCGIARSASFGLSGGLISKIQGGSFSQGFKNVFGVAAAISLGQWAYERAVVFSASWKSSEGPAGDNGRFNYDEGLPRDKITVSEKGKTLGFNKHTDKPGFWERKLGQGRGWANAAERVPGMSAISKMHDWIQQGFDYIVNKNDSWLRTAANIPAMAPATALTVPALIAPVQQHIYTYDSIYRNKDAY